MEFVSWNARQVAQVQGSYSLSESQSTVHRYAPLAAKTVKTDGLFRALSSVRQRSSTAILTACSDATESDDE